MTKEGGTVDTQILPVEVKLVLSGVMVRCADINPHSVTVVTVMRIINAVDEGRQHDGQAGFAGGSGSSPQQVYDKMCQHQPTQCESSDGYAYYQCR